MKKIELSARTHSCGELNQNQEGQQVTLCGWVKKRRDHGQLIFIDLRDVKGITQIVFDPGDAALVYSIAKNLKPEYVVQIKGQVRKRPDGMINKNMPTGDIEVVAKECEILNEAETTPFPIVDQVDATDESLFRYRYLDLRRPEMQRNMILRHKTYQIARQYLAEQDFIEIETPFLMRSTPEGARDYLVPSRIHKGKFYALPQSPQTYKQLLMVAGYDRYFQIVKCFRDEDFRAERQPEFTQIDIEMSFVEEKDVFRITEGLMSQIFKKLFDIELEPPFPVISFDTAMSNYGTDKPDLRFGMEIEDVSEAVAGSQFNVFSATVQSGGIVAGINLKNGAGYSRKQIDNLNQFIVDLGGKGVLTAKIKNGTWDASFAKFLTEEMKSKVDEKMGSDDGDLLLLIAGERQKTLDLLGRLRVRLANDEQLIKRDEYRPAWVVDFPLLEFDEEEQRFIAMHHPFTSPQKADLASLETEPERIKARAYDLVLNGYEIAGGSIRNHQYDTQMKVFRLLNIDEKEAHDKFGFLLDALKYGAPPHGGIAFGFDRMVMILAGEDSIRKVIAFPKTTSAISLMDNSPAEVSEKQLRDLGLKIIKD